MGIEVKSTETGPNQVRVELEFNAEGALHNLSHAELGFGKADHPAVIAPLREDRSKPGRVVVGFIADRTQLEELSLRVKVPEEDGGTIYVLRGKDFAEQKKPADEIKVGDVAPSIEGTSLDGKEMKLSDFRGKVVLLVFWFKSCGPCLAEVPHLQALVERHKDKPFVIVGVNNDDDGEAAREVAAKEGMTWPSFADGNNGPIVKQWQVDAWPTKYLLDDQGVIRYGNDSLSRTSVRKGPAGKFVQFWRLDDSVEEILNDLSGKK
jgi:peroxiredoxin